MMDYFEASFKVFVSGAMVLDGCKKNDVVGIEDLVVVLN